jgi:hypothetical protein
VKVCWTAQRSAGEQASYHNAKQHLRLRLLLALEVVNESEGVV